MTFSPLARLPPNSFSLHAPRSLESFWLEQYFNHAGLRISRRKAGRASLMISVIPGIVSRSVTIHTRCHVAGLDAAYLYVSKVQSGRLKKR